MSCWIRLGIDPTQDLNAIRQAYRSRLPAHHPETDPQGFQALREAYEQAQRLAREHDSLASEPEPSEEDAPHDALKSFYQLLEEPSLRFDPQAWQRYIGELDELPLEQLEDVSAQLLHTLRDCGPISHTCANLLAERLGWAAQVLRMHDAQEVEAFLARLAEPDPFDTSLMRDWPATTQLETLWYLRSLAFCFEQRPLFEFEHFAAQHTCLALPDDDALVQRLAEQFSLALIPSPTFHALLQQRHAQAPDDADLLYLLARQADTLGHEQEAQHCWLKLWREHRHPMAERWLIELCQRQQPQRLPLLIQAIDTQHTPDTWPQDLTDPAQAIGSPAQSPKTLARWSEAARLELDGIAAIFIDWCLDGDDELPLLAWLLQDQPDHALHRLYWQAWALQRGEAGLLRNILAEKPSDELFDALILEGFQQQARRHLHWLEHSPVVRELVRFCNGYNPHIELPKALDEDHNRPLCREWLRRVRVYSGPSVRGLNRHFEMRRLFTVPFAMVTQGELSDKGIVLPPMVEGEALWNWHRQQLFMLAMADQPERWMAMLPEGLVQQLAYPIDHPFVATHQLLLERQTDGHSNVLLSWLNDHDPMQAFIANRLLTLAYVFNASRLPSAKRLLECLENDTDTLDEHPLGYLLLCAVLYHDPALDAQQRARLRDRLDALNNDSAWFAPLRDGLVKGKVKALARNTLEQEEGIDTQMFNDALKAFNHLVDDCTTPPTKLLLRLQKGKDDAAQDTGLRCAIMALLSWSERLLMEYAAKPAAPSWAVWRLNSRIGRGDLGAQLVVMMLIGAAARAYSVTLVLLALLVLSALLRRLRDLGRGVPSLVMLVMVSRLLPVLPFVLLGVPGDKLPNRYGPSPAEPDQLQDGLQVALRRLINQ